MNFVYSCAGRLPLFLPTIGRFFGRSVFQLEAIGTTLAIRLSVATEGTVVAFERATVAIRTRGVFGTYNDC